MLADFVLHMISMSSIFDGKIAVELGAGTGAFQVSSVAHLF